MFEVIFYVNCDITNFWGDTNSFVEKSAQFLKRMFKSGVQNSWTQVNIYEWLLFLMQGIAIGMVLTFMCDSLYRNLTQLIL